MIYSEFTQCAVTVRQMVLDERLVVCKTTNFYFVLQKQALNSSNIKLNLTLS